MKTFIEHLIEHEAALVFGGAEMHSPGRVEEVRKCVKFARTSPTCFERTNTSRHFTGSSLIVDDRARKTLLVHHKKYDKWVQPGGHCDGISDPFFTAWQESYQETGLKNLVPVAPWCIADINVQEVPAYGDVAAHWHYDIRYVFRANSQDEIVVSDESNDVRWVDVDRLSEFTEEAALHRLVDFHFRQRTWAR